ncbi:MAG: hypothetical protein IJU72_09870 [Bacteroidales bacterium]|nr:hypothetical protein [Bacteroidales bacterium]
MGRWEAASWHFLVRSCCRIAFFGVEKEDADRAFFINGRATIGKLHKSYWQKQHHRAVAKGDERSIFYQERNYTMIPRGCVFLDEVSERFYVCVGSWLHDVNEEQFRVLLEDEFNLPIDFDLVVDEHWDLGHGWSEEVF